MTAVRRLLLLLLLLGLGLGCGDASEPNRPRLCLLTTAPSALACDSTGLCVVCFDDLSCQKFRISECPPLGQEEDD